MKDGYTMLPAGYRLTVWSWENDADNYQTNTMQGLSKDETKFLIEFCRLFENAEYEDGGFGNITEGSDELYENLARAIMDIVERGDGVPPASMQRALDAAAELDHDENWYIGIARAAGEIHNSLFGSTEFEFRMYDKHTVEYLDHDVYMRIVTNEF